MVSQSNWSLTATGADQGARVVAICPCEGLAQVQAELQRNGAMFQAIRPGPDRAWAALTAEVSAVGADLVLVDLSGGMPPDASGALVSAAVAAGMPVAALTAAPDDLEEMRCLVAGADAYLDLRDPAWKLCLRLRALRRRQRAGRPDGAGIDGAGIDGASIMERGPLRIDMDRREVCWSGARVQLSETELSLLAALAQRPGYVKTRAQLMDVAYAERYDVTDRTIDSHIKRLRKKLRALDPQFSAIRTLYGVGYSFLA